MASMAAAGPHDRRFGSFQAAATALVCSMLLLSVEAAPQTGVVQSAAPAKSAPATSKCIEYQPKTCWFALQADPAKQPIHFPQCAFVDCKFDVEKELVCPFASGGAFVETERADCPDFMKVSKRKVPDCSKACCGGVVAGRFVRDKADPAAMHYRAAKGAGCQYVNHRRHEVVNKLLGERIDIVVAGDSMMRQLYTRLVQMLRGRRRVFDYRVHTHASYEYCDEGDAFRTASYLANMKQPEKKYLLDVIPEFFARDPEQGPRNCSRSAGRIDFLHAPLFATHGDALEAYVQQADPKRKLIILSYVGVWTKVHQIPGKYFQSLERVLQRPEGALILTLSVPTLKELRAPARAAKYRVRTAQLRRWVLQHSPAAGYIDFDSLSLTPNGPPNTNHDKHWSCYTTWPQEGRGGAAMAKLRREMLAVNSFRERLYDNPIGHIWMTTDGECYDEMNRAVWVIALNAIMQTTATANRTFSFAPGAFDQLAQPIHESDRAMADSAPEQAVSMAAYELLFGKAYKERPGGAAKAGVSSADAAIRDAAAAGSAVPHLAHGPGGGKLAAAQKATAGGSSSSSSGGSVAAARSAGGSRQRAGRSGGGGGGKGTAGGGTAGAAPRSAKPAAVDDVLAGDDQAASTATQGAAADADLSADASPAAAGGSGSPARAAKPKAAKNVVDVTVGAAAAKRSAGGGGGKTRALPKAAQKPRTDASGSGAKAAGAADAGNSGVPQELQPAARSKGGAARKAAPAAGSSLQAGVEESLDDSGDESADAAEGSAKGSSAGDSSSQSSGAKASGSGGRAAGSAGSGDAAGAAAGGASAASVKADTAAAAEDETSEEAATDASWQPHAGGAGTDVAGSDSTGSGAAALADAADDSADDADLEADGSADEADAGATASGSRIGGARPAGTSAAGADLAAAGRRHADTPQTTASAAGTEDLLTTLIARDAADSEDDTLRGAGGSETAGDARPASRAAGSSATGSAAARLSEDETLDVDGETAPLIDEDA